MENRDVIIVGGGPAGSSAAHRLQKAGQNVLILDKQEFPRLKLCAGWITPEVLEALEITPEEYPHGILTMQHFHIKFRGLPVNLDTLQYSIRRIEFDDWLLQRSKVDVRKHTVQNIIQDEEGYYIIDNTYRAKYLIGAGGTSCPVGRALFSNVHPREKVRQAVTLEEEFAHDKNMDPESAHLWFFEDGMPGYSWVVPKSGGYVNVGIGALAQRLIRRKENIRDHWLRFIDKLDRLEIIKGHDFRPGGHNYYMASRKLKGKSGNAYLTGDAAGLATRDLAEGIGPAIQSGLMAADSILHDKEYNLNKINFYSIGIPLAGRFVELYMSGR